MTQDSKSFARNATLALVAVSFGLCTILVAVDVGIWNTPYETMDSAGNKMGFNDPLSMEHYRILLSNFRIQKLFALDYVYSWLLWGMHGWGIWLLWRTDHMGRSQIRWFFGMQGLLFPVGWLGFLVWPTMIRWVLKGTFDRESIIDGPFIALTAHPIWIVTAMTIFTVSWRASLQATAQTERNGFEPV